MIVTVGKYPENKTRPYSFHLFLKCRKELLTERQKTPSSSSPPSQFADLVLDDWKLANVMTIHKKVQKDNMGNYRPTSLTLVHDKVMEQIILRAKRMARESGLASMDLGGAGPS
ncbi:RNA-directed DNA polymerase from mobile element jockey [Willisornis vidua]|uniref:RNA-directed DNA polymerase from mobile element jockey n=1 Tax=Willisornis vidua TaxID=1566151 RepID=A0ABQ9D6D6_9PASS|nr:RNA-directed DNA polymerase from mobile element jockey [Willisornis vidua]